MSRHVRPGAVPQGTQSSYRQVRNKLAYRNNCANVSVDYCDVYSGHFEMPWYVAPSNMLVPDALVQWMSGIDVVCLLALMILNLMTFGFVSYNDPWWAVTIFYNISYFRLIAPAFFFFFWWYQGMRFSGRGLAFEGAPANMSAEEIVVRRGRVWHFLNEKKRLWFYPMVFYIFYFVAVYSLQRASSTINTAPVRWMSGDNGALGATAMFYVPMGTMAYVIFMLFTGLEFIVVWPLASSDAARLSIWIANNDPVRFLENPMAAVFGAPQPATALVNV